MKYKILIGIVVLYVAIIGILLFINEMSKTQLVLFPDTVIEYNGKKWKKVTLNQNKKYNIYVNNKFLTKSYIKNDDGEITVDGKTIYDYFASNKEIIVVDYISKEVSDEEKDSILKLAGINSKFITVSNKIDIDYDKDGQIETLYFLANTYGGSEADDLFSLIYVKDSTSKFVFERKYSSEKTAMACDLGSIINIGGSNKFIIKCPGFSNSGINVKVYEAKKDNLVLIADI